MSSFSYLLSHNFLVLPFSIWPSFDSENIHDIANAPGLSPSPFLEYAALVSPVNIVVPVYHNRSDVWDGHSH